MDALLIDKKELADLLSMGKENARKFCERHGVLPINTSTGKRATLRWSRLEVMQMVSTLQAKGKEEEFVPKKRTSRTVLGKSLAQLKKELQQASSLPLQ